MALEELFFAENPDAVLVVGDVNSTLAAALAAAKIHIPVIHLEAGLRSGDMSMPEEVNRLVTDQLSAALLTPTADAADNLVREGVDASADRLRRQHHGRVGGAQRAPDRGARPGRGPTGCAQGEYVLVTVHRPENTDHPEKLSHVAAALNESPLPVLFPVHPRTRPKLAEAGLVDTSGSRPGNGARDPPRRPRRLPRHARAAARRRGGASPTPAACKRRRACSARRA